MMVAVVIAIVVVIVVVVFVIFVFVVLATRSFRHIVLFSANRNHGSSRKVPDIEIIDLPLFALIYCLVNYEIQFQEVRECAFINNSKRGLKVV
jgi:hypothetical protein